jgi:hypothetical protein
MIITRLIKHGNIFHAVILDQHGKYHHEKFYDKGRAIDYIETYYHNHRQIVSYKV